MGLGLACAVLAALAGVAGCLAQPEPGSLAPTLTMAAVDGTQVAMQDGIPVPSYGFQPRPRIDLAGPWRFTPRVLDTNLSLTDRTTALKGIEAEAGGRQGTAYDDSAWATAAVPGTLDPAPNGGDVGGWYRTSFVVPSAWAGMAVTLKFGAVNYLADVWLDGHYLGYHEGGSTPFAFPVDGIVRPGSRSVLAVRVDLPGWGRRDDIVPWGLADWWNYGGITQPVLLEASEPVSAARADVVPHLDGADVRVVVENRGHDAATAAVTVDILPAVVTAANLADPDPRALLPAHASPVATQTLPAASLASGAVAVLETSFLIRNAARWSLGRPAVYVLRVTTRSPGARTDEFLDTFGLRHVSVDPSAPRLLLNGLPVMLHGVNVQPERVAT